MNVLHSLRSAPSYYEATVTRPPPAPALAGDVRTQVAVVGGGFAGVSTALELAARGFRVTLLEAQRIGAVASGRNGGQVLAGLACEMATIEKQLGREAAGEVWRLTEAAVRLVRERLQRHAIDADARDGTLFVACSPRSAAAMEASVGESAARYGGSALSWLDRDAVRRAVASAHYHGGWREADSLHLHPLKYLLGLAAAAQAAGVTVHEHSRVLRLDGGAQPVLHTAGGRLRADTVVLAGGAPLGETIPPFGRLTMPYDSWILATEALDPALAAALIPGGEAVADDSYDIDYYRITPDRRLLFGTGVNYLARSPAAARTYLAARMARVFPQLAGVRTAELWGGVMELPMNRAPVLGRLAPNVLHVQGFGGHGVAFTGMAGVLAAEAIAGDTARFELMARVRHRPFPFGRWLQVPMMMAGTYWYRWTERFAT